MAGLFKNRTIRDRLEKFEIPEIEQKLEIIKAWHKASKNGELQKKTETQCEQAFNQDFFIKILGYKPFPNDTYTIQPKDNVETGGGQMPDATLGYFDSNGKRVIAVVEIKDAKTPLDKSQHREGNLSPVQQAFKYKPQYKNCSFVIATNFIEIRLFRDNQLDFESFKLDDLVNPKDDYFNFRKFYFLLCVQNFVIDTGETETEKLLSAIRIEQEKITNKFYKEYKQLREDLIKDIVANNTQIKRGDFYNRIVEKAQKLVDRIVFICFFEDSGLLPENRLAEVVEYAQKGVLHEPIWDTLKKFFRAVDEGSERLGVPDGYNGELFKLDDELDALKISDEVCTRFVGFSKYDFEEDLSVNILGHIFEQSITDLEKLKEYAAGKSEEYEEKASKRRRDGIFYTPDYIVDYIVKSSLGRFLEQKEQDILAKHKLDSKRIKLEETYDKRALSAYVEYQEMLRKIRVLDPACGSGAFLVKVFDYLLAENKRVSSIIASINGTVSIFDMESYVKDLLQNNIFGVDLNPESVDITKLSLWLKSAQRGKKLVTLRDNIKCGNSLLDSDIGENSRFFNWASEFKDVFENGGFDVIVGNPPYVNAITLSKNVDEGVRKHWKKQYVSAVGTYDLYVLFFELGMNLLKDNGYLAYITPNKYVSAEFAKGLRKLIADEYEVVELFDYSSTTVFQDPMVYPVITVLKKSKSKDYSILVKKVSDDLENPITKELPSTLLHSFEDKKFSLLLSDDSSTINNWLKDTVELQILAEVNASTTAREWDVISKYIEENKGGKKVINTGTIDRYVSLWGFTPLKNKKTTYLKPTFDPSKVKLSDHRLNIFNSQKIVLAKLALQIEACYDESGETAPVSTNCIYSPKSGISLLYILALLNSKLMTYVYRQLFGGLKMGGGYLQYQAPQIRKLPIKVASNQVDFEDIVKKLLILHKEHSETLVTSLTLLKSELPEGKISRKMAKFYLLDFESFIHEAHADWSMEKKTEMLSFFEKSKDKINKTALEIEALEREIDQKVFALYGLTESEQKAVLSV